MRLITLISCVLFLTWSCGSDKATDDNASQNSQDTIVKKDQNDPPPARQLEFQIMMINWDFGFQRVTTTITSDSAIQKVVNGQNFLEIERLALSKDQSESIQSHLMTFPWTEIQASYINPDVQDGTIMDFKIRTAKHGLSVNVSNYYIPALGELARIASGIFSQDHIKYNKNTVPWEFED